MRDGILQGKQQPRRQHKDKQTDPLPGILPRLCRSLILSPHRTKRLASDAVPKIPDSRLLPHLAFEKDGNHWVGTYTTID
jgi:hypothetical protein